MDFAAGLDQDLLLCRVRDLCEYLRRTSAVVNRPRRLLVSPRTPSRAMSKNGRLSRISCKKSFMRLALAER